MQWSYGNERVSAVKQSDMLSDSQTYCQTVRHAVIQSGMLSDSTQSSLCYAVSHAATRESVPMSVGFRV